MKGWEGERGRLGGKRGKKEEETKLCTGQSGDLRTTFCPTCEGTSFDQREVGQTGERWFDELFLRHFDWVTCCASTWKWRHPKVRRPQPFVQPVAPRKFRYSDPYGDPLRSEGFSIKSWSNDYEDLGYHHWNLLKPHETTRYFFRYNGIPCLSGLIFWCFEYHPPMIFQTQFSQKKIMLFLGDLSHL